MTKLKAKEVMNRKVLTVQAAWSIEHLSDFLLEHSISGAPVIAGDDKLVGVVSMTDIARYNAMPIKENYKEEPHNYYLHVLENQYSPADLSAFHVEEESTVKVMDIMTPAVFNVDEEADIDAVSEIMVRGRIHRVMVTKEDKIVGIITALDILKALFDIQ